MKNPFRRISNLEAENASLTARISELEKAVVLLVRDDAQIAALNRIVGAVEYLQKSEAHHREQAGQRHEF